LASANHVKTYVGYNVVSAMLACIHARHVVACARLADAYAKYVEDYVRLVYACARRKTIQKAKKGAKNG
jgi:hypothetical protein